MITIWIKQDEMNWTLVEEFPGSMEELAARLESLRADGNEYRAERRDQTISEILGV
jgi:hypothetical protein